ncbi:hypothetical protein [uncultured Christiangramia sp.]|uniref:hypothetical protein n=1 Tax=uncultured Christiangramia sp. TaxID=503836 RepID=UPI00261A2B0A|nr:hypothetical protein [uncultured Christiangramia sp.]
MKRIIGIIALLLIFGCSYNTDFYIINTSNKDVIIEYEIRNSSQGQIFISDPKVAKFDKKLNKIDPEVIEQVEQVEENRFKIKLKSYQGILLGYDINFNLKNKVDYEKLNDNMKELRIYKNDRLIIKSDSTNTAKLFKKVNRNLIIIDIDKASR